MKYSSCNVFPSLDYKREGRGQKKISRFVEEGLLSDWEPSFLLLYRCSLKASWKVASASRKTRELPKEAPLRAFCVRVCVGVSACSLTGLPVVISNNIVFVSLS